MPYVALAPAYWFLGGISKDYCAARVLSLSTNTAQEAANDSARRFAQNRGARLVGDTETDKHSIEKLTGWDITRTGACSFGGGGWWNPLRWILNTSLGVYAGIPLSYETNLKTSDGSYEVRKVRTRGSVGLAVMPVPYLNILIGVTRTAIEEPVPAKGEKARRFDEGWHWTFSIGGTADIVTALLKALT